MSQESEQRKGFRLAACARCNSTGVNMRNRIAGEDPRRTPCAAANTRPVASHMAVLALRLGSVWHGRADDSSQSPQEEGGPAIR